MSNDAAAPLPEDWLFDERGIATHLDPPAVDLHSRNG